MDDAQPVFRFAPSPNGELHLGHAYSALLNHHMAREAGGRFLLRMEDIDRARCSLENERRIEADLHWLGVEWDEPPRRQSIHFADYAAALDALIAEGLVYPAFMSRGAVRAFAEHYAEREGRSWPRDPDGALLYPGEERGLGEVERAERIAEGEAFAWRLDMASALARLGRLDWLETGAGPEGETGRVAAEPSRWGDVILARKEIPTSYHLAVVVDDALQGVTHVVRGRDLFHSTSVHRVIQALLGLPAPVYHHHDLILGDDGRKLSKSAGDVSLKALREAGLTAADIRRMVGF
ncbi:tRNA glutamyl-Q(34) synthetase GluQRS [Consotaella salsifontis]|uniref:Glutamyl-Q tRNA(Asp) synthetase n=1 Tax=Consotaella salsifontis TaxID=1365950 RepID=A0A1T4RS97_9HYPH|nr:tRNA glutamyl-Q(34) synthetase GluQRS [Consotaella salsifontis]SKA18802.1 glutamyl-Q tRNA(Asp) synthetase [Consotaella salsifontis]